MRVKEKISETDIAAVVVEYLEAKNWDVYQEVQLSKYSYGNSADILAVKNNEIWIIETKTSLTFTVLSQAERWDVNYRSIAVPEAKKSDGRKMAYRICRQFNIGALAVSPLAHEVMIEVAPTRLSDPNIDRTVAYMLESLTPYHKNGVAGSTSGGAITPYKVTMMKVKEFIEANPGCSLNEIVENLGPCHYRTINSAKNAIRTALGSWEDWCKVDHSGRNGYGYFLKEANNQ